MSNDVSYPDLVKQLAMGNLGEAYLDAHALSLALGALCKVLFAEPPGREMGRKALGELGSPVPSSDPNPPRQELAKDEQLILGVTQFCATWKMIDQRKEWRKDDCVAKALAAVRSAPARLGQKIASSMTQLIRDLCRRIALNLWHSVLLEPLLQRGLALAIEALYEDEAFQRAAATAPMPALERYLKYELKGFDSDVAEAEIEIEFQRAAAFRYAHNIPAQGTGSEPGEDLDRDAAQE